MLDTFIKYKTYLFLYIPCMAAFFMACHNEQSIQISKNIEIQYAMIPDSCIAGDSIVLEFTTNSQSQFSLIVANSYTQTIVTPIFKRSSISFYLPQYICNKAGVCHWALCSEKQIITKGNITIHPHKKSTQNIETYLGPREIIAGGTDFSMLVVAPTDSFDNPLQNHSIIDVNTQRKNKRTESQIKTMDFVAFQNIYSTYSTGPIFVAANTINGVSSEMTSTVQASIPIDFLINFKQKHKFADGNQTIEIETSTIKDEFGNIVSDGTLVNFAINNNRNQYSYGKASTINGVAKGLFLHPYEAQNWTVKAYISGAAISNQIEIAFEQASTNFELKYEASARCFHIDSALSYMGQKVPDGTLILCSLLTLDGKKIYNTEINTKDGIGIIDVSNQLLPKGQYTAHIELMGIVKTINIEIYDHIID